MPVDFRADAIEAFDGQPGWRRTFVPRSVGRQGHEIKTPPTDADMAKTIEAIAATSDRSHAPNKTIDGHEIAWVRARTLAGEQAVSSCRRPAPLANRAQ